MENWLRGAVLFCGCLLVAVAAQSVDTNVAVPHDSGSIETTSIENVSSENASVETTSAESVEGGVAGQHVPLDTSQFQQQPIILGSQHPVGPQPAAPKETFQTSHSSQAIRRPLPSIPFRRPSRPIQYVPTGAVQLSDLPFKRDEFKLQVYDFVPDQAAPNTFTADCAAPTNPYFFQRPGYMIGIWDDKDSFASVDKIKCLRGGDEDDDSDESGELDDDVFFELDPNQYEQIDLDPKSPTHKPACSPGSLLTGLTKAQSEYGVAPVVTGHCLKLIRGEVNYDVCQQIGTEAKSGGAFEPYVDWGVECQFGHAAVGVKVDAKRVLSLRCCKLTPSRIYGTFGK